MSELIGRNSPCPCGERRKYKNCCKDKVPWEQILAHGGHDEHYRSLSLRGKNIVLLNGIQDALQLDQLPKDADFQRLKNAVTPEAVWKIHDLIGKLWPDADDLKRVLRREAEHSSGLYFGRYELPVLLRGITRHSLYSERILIPDPFAHPLSRRDEFNPLVHPERHRVETLRAIHLWFYLAPWIFAGIVGIIQLPGDFDSALAIECYRREEDRVDQDPELRALLKELVEAESRKWGPTDRGEMEYFALCYPNEYFIEQFHEICPDGTQEQLQEMLHEIEHRRKTHPYYIDLASGEGRESQLLVQTTGTNYEMAKVTVAMSGSHLITDLPNRWKEIELDRARDKIDPLGWNPFAKAFHRLEFSFLNDVPLKFAFRLREERRLDRLRLFLKGIWNKCSTENAFDEKNTELLAAELNETVQEAKEEWRKIDRDLIKWFGAIGTAIAPAAILGGSIAWIPAAIGGIVGGTASLLVAQHQRAGFHERYPAAMFLDLEQNAKR